MNIMIVRKSKSLIADEINLLQNFVLKYQNVLKKIHLLL